MIILPKDQVPRYERKYMISDYQVEQLRLILDTLCFRDQNTQEDGTYNIRSLYFDDYLGSSYRDNVMGLDVRSKYRIRIYNCKDDYLNLEQKIKAAGKIYKKRTLITKSCYEAILQDSTEQIDYPNTDSLMNCFMTDYYSKYLRPAVIVDYDREPYIYPDGDVRITFDRNISFSNDFDSFFDKNLFLQPILPDGMQLLEVKYTEFLPEFIYQQLARFNLQQCTFSKYYLCEKYKRMGE